MRTNNTTPYGWEAEYDAWIKQQIDSRNFANLINYQNSHKLGKLAAPTPDHYVPVLYSLGLIDKTDEIKHFSKVNQLFQLLVNVVLLLNPELK